MVDGRDGQQHFLQFVIVRTGVHEDGAAQRPGDAAGKFQARQAFFRRHLREFCQAHAGLCKHGLPLDAHPVHTLSDADDHPVVAAVFKEHVAAVAQHEVRDVLRADQIQHVHQFSQTSRCDKKIRRASAAETGMQVHGLIFGHPVLVGIVKELFFDLLYVHS